MSVNISHLFPIILGKANERYEVGPLEKEWVNSLDRDRNHLNMITTRADVLKDKEAAPLFRFLQQNLDTFFHENYNPPEGAKIKIVQSWVNFAKKGQAHHKHFHPNSFISGVYYLNCVENDRIVFYPPSQTAPSISRLHLWGDHATPYHNFETVVDVCTGELILFPSTLEHSVPSVVTVDGEERISLAFNTFVEGSFGEDRFKNKLTIKVIDD